MCGSGVCGSGVCGSGVCGSGLCGSVLCGSVLCGSGVSGSGVYGLGVSGSVDDVKILQICQTTVEVHPYRPSTDMIFHFNDASTNVCLYNCAIRVELLQESNCA